VGKKFWADEMSSVDVVDQAARWSRDLAQMRSRGPGDLENAMRSIEREYGVDYWTQWNLRYRRSRLRDIGHTVFLKLCAAYQAECARQERRLSHEREIARRIAGPDHAAVREAEALVGSAPRTSNVPQDVWEK
jgi:hypothetical protein